MILLLTLRGLSLLFKMLPTGVSAAYILATVHFLYPNLGSFSDMEYYFYQFRYRDLKVGNLINVVINPEYRCHIYMTFDPYAVQSMIGLKGQPLN